MNFELQVKRPSERHFAELSHDASRLLCCLGARDAVLEGATAIPTGRPEHCCGATIGTLCGGAMRAA